MHKAKSGGNKVRASKSLLPGKSHQWSFFPPETSCDNSCEMLSTREAYDKVGAQGFLRVGHTGILFLVWTKFLTAKGKHVFSISCIVCTDSLGRASYSYHLASGQNPPKT